MNVLLATLCALVFVAMMAVANGARRDASALAAFIVGWSALVGCVAFVALALGAPAPF